MRVRVGVGGNIRENIIMFSLILPPTPTLMFSQILPPTPTLMYVFSNIDPHPHPHPHIGGNIREKILRGGGEGGG
jgi:hypothetical protein